MGVNIVVTIGVSNVAASLIDQPVVPGTSVFPIPELGPQRILLSGFLALIGEF